MPPSSIGAVLALLNWGVNWTRSVPQVKELCIPPTPHFLSPRSWVQVACPRLSIDWGEAFEKPLLTPYEVKGGAWRLREGEGWGGIGKGSR